MTPKERAEAHHEILEALYQQLALVQMEVSLKLDTLPTTDSEGEWYLAGMGASAMVVGMWLDEAKKAIPPE